MYFFKDVLKHSPTKSLKRWCQTFERLLNFFIADVWSCSIQLTSIFLLQARFSGWSMVERLLK